MVLLRVVPLESNVCYSTFSARVRMGVEHPMGKADHSIHSDSATGNLYTADCNVQMSHGQIHCALRVGLVFRPNSRSCWVVPYRTDLTLVCPVLLTFQRLKEILITTQTGLQILLCSEIGKSKRSWQTFRLSSSLLQKRHSFSLPVDSVWDAWQCIACPNTQYTAANHNNPTRNYRKYGSRVFFLSVVVDATNEWAALTSQRVI